MKYRKKPIEIEAVRFNRPKTIRDFCPAAKAIYDGNRVAWFQIKTLEGDMALVPGAWLIRGIHGEFYPCKPEIFEATYEAVE